MEDVMSKHEPAAAPLGYETRPLIEGPLFRVFDAARTRRLDAVARGLLRYGLVGLLVLWGGMKFFDFEAQAIRPLIENHPFMSWMYPVFGVRGASALIGVIEVGSAILIAARRLKPAWSAIGSLVAAVTFLTTLSFLITTPGAFSPDSPIGGFLMKDVMLLAAALFTAAETLGGSKVARADAAHGEKV
jgi:reactive chlorine resistance protein C